MSLLGYADNVPTRSFRHISLVSWFRTRVVACILTPTPIFPCTTSTTLISLTVIHYLRLCVTVVGSKRHGSPAFEDASLHYLTLQKQPCLFVEVAINNTRSTTGSLRLDSEQASDGTWTGRLVQFLCISPGILGKSLSTEL